MLSFTIAEEACCAAGERDLQLKQLHLYGAAGVDGNERRGSGRRGGHAIERGTRWAVVRVACRVLRSQQGRTPLDAVHGAGGRERRRQWLTAFGTIAAARF